MKQILISHRGNLNGPNPNLENSPDYVMRAIDLGFHCEVDVWYDGKDYWLGHDSPEYVINEEFLQHPHLICHAKNIEALEKMIHNRYIHCFWHEKDQVVLTSRGWLWCYPRLLKLTKSCIALFPELYPGDFDFSICSGICSDHIGDSTMYNNL